MIDVSYVTQGDFFWLSMGMTAATGIFIGALIYNGDLSMFKKGLVTITSYAAFLFLTIFSRIVGNRPLYIFDRHPQSTAGLVTIVFITIFYIAGMAIGVYTVNKLIKHSKHDSV